MHIESYKSIKRSKSPFPQMVGRHYLTKWFCSPNKQKILEANDEITFNVFVSISSYDLLDTGTFSSTIDGVAYNETAGSITFESKILWTIIPQPDVEVGEMNETIAPEISGSTLTTFYVGTGAIVIIGGLAWLLVTLIRKRKTRLGQKIT